ncbi:MAG: anti-sigma factor family protein [Hyphomicrobiaceae bacterium]
MMRLDCSEVRDLIPALVDGELTAEDRRAVASHMAGCPDCSAAHDELAKLSGAIKSAGTFAMPPHLEARARHTVGLANRDASPWTRRTLALLAASHLAVAVVAVGLGYGLLQRGDQQHKAASQAVAAHVRATFADQPFTVASSDQHTVRPWFTGKLDYAPPVRDLTSDGFPLRGGRVDYVLDRTAAALVYGRRKHVISVFVLPVGAAPASLPAATARDGYTLLAWQADGFAYVAVSDLNRAEMETLRSLLQATR